MTKLLSAASPATNLLPVYSNTPFEHAVSIFPLKANMLAKTNTCNLPIRSANTPSAILPETEPAKNIDCPNAGIQLSVPVQFI